MSVITEVCCDAVWGNEHTPCAQRFHRTGHTPAQLSDAARQVGWHVGPDGDWCPNHNRLLAVPYADRAGYRDEWRL